MILGLSLVLALFVQVTLGAHAAQEEDRLFFKEDLLFYASFDHSAEADFARGTATPLDLRGGGAVPGKAGQGLYFGRAGGVRQLRYAAKDNIRLQQGTVAFYFKGDWAGDSPDTHFFFIFPGPANISSSNNAPDTVSILTLPKAKDGSLLSLWLGDHAKGINTAPIKLAPWRPGQWRHLAGVWDEERVKLYVDGELLTDRPIRGRMIDAGKDFLVGANRGGNSPCEGIIDEFYIYGRALTTGEVGLLTGRPEFITPKIHRLTLQQAILFNDEIALALECELTGRIDPDRDRLEAELRLAAERTTRPAANASWPARSGRYVLPLSSGLAEGAYVLTLRLVDASGRPLVGGAAVSADSGPARASALLRIVASPFVKP